MGDFVYQGEHSITIDPDGKKYNTWTSFNMAPQTRPFVASPPIKEEYIDVPGADGSLDYTEVLAGKTRYGRRTGSWNFIIENGHENWPSFYSKLLNELHGKEYKIVLDDDPEYYYKGRLSIVGSFGNKDYSSVTINYNLDPYKYPIGTTAGENWKWNDLFGITIYYGKFSVNGEKAHTILNEQSASQVCNINCTNPMTIYPLNDFNDNHSNTTHGISSVNTLVSNGMSLTEARIYCLINSNFDESFCKPVYTTSGDNDFTLKSGDNVLYFKGSGLVTIEYERGKTL